MVEDDVKKAIQTAIQMEKDGYSFYMKAAAQTSSEMGRSVFESLADDEELHLNVFEKLFEDKVGNDDWDDLVNSSKKYAELKIFPKDLTDAEAVSPDTNELDALNFAMNSEQEAIDYYTKIREDTEDAEVKKIIDEIIEQEKSHYMILQEEFSHLSATGYWYELDFLGG